ncbi:hypothetical protein I4U23_023605 [Adineta vaga]|nr:hypothetical protein I4U23_023605 [Adineta vaga]
MLVILIIFSFLLYSRIQTRDLNDEIGVNIFEVFKEKKITCDLRDFVTSADNPEREYNMLIHDLTKHCSTSVTANLAPILCRIILIELEIGCTLPNKTRPTPVKYTHSYTSEQICSMHKIVYTNKWIWEKLTKKERIQIGSSWTQLCPQLTSTNSTLRLTRFFYKMAPRIRHAENLNTAPSVNNTSDHSIVDTIHISRETNSPTNTSIKELDQLSINKSIVQEVIPKKQNKYQSIFDSRKKRLKSSKTQRNLGRRKHYLDKERENLLDFAGEETQVIKKRIALKEPKEQNEALVRLRRTGIRAEFDAGNGNKRNGNNWFKGTHSF